MAVLVRCVFCIGMFASNMVATTRVGEMACALQWLHVPKHGVIAICVALRFFPTLSQEFASVRDALRVRGMPLTAASVVRHPVRTLERVLVPVMSRLAIVADELSNAAMARGMDSACRRTSYYRLRMGAMDWLLLAAFSALAVYLLARGWELPDGCGHQLKGAGFRYASAEAGAVGGIDLVVHAGEVVVVTGPSGCGRRRLRAW